MPQYNSDIVLGEEYEHAKLELKGIASAIYFFQHACERVTLQYINDGELQEATFDSLELRHVETQAPVVSEKKGGPRGPSSLSAARR